MTTKNSSPINTTPDFERELVTTLCKRMQEPRKFIQVVTGPRQTGKTTAIRQALQKTNLPYRFVSADLAAERPQEWLQAEWQQARDLITEVSPSAILIIDEVQNIRQWSSVVKMLWDQDAWPATDLRVILSGSSSLLLQKGLSESLMGRFEVLRSTHWSYHEMQSAFGYEINDYLLYGGYPAGALFKDNRERWRWYMNDAVVEATLSKDVLQMEEIRRPALLRKLFILGCQFSAQELSYRKLVGQLDDTSNVATVAHYLELLAAAGLLCGIQKYDDKLIRTRKSSPRLMAFDTALITSTSFLNKSPLETPEIKGHLVESAVGANLLALSQTERFSVFWWREGLYEVDFIIARGDQLTAIEVKSGRVKDRKGLMAFKQKYPEARLLVVGDRNNPIEEFLSGKIPLFA